MDGSTNEHIKVSNFDRIGCISLAIYLNKAIVEEHTKDRTNGGVILLEPSGNRIRNNELQRRARLGIETGA